MFIINFFISSFNRSISKNALELHLGVKTKKGKKDSDQLSAQEKQALILALEEQMKTAASNLDFETAIKIRDQLLRLKY